MTIYDDDLIFDWFTGQWFTSEEFRVVLAERIRLIYGHY